MWAGDRSLVFEVFGCIGDAHMGGERVGFVGGLSIYANISQCVCVYVCTCVFVCVCVCVSVLLCEYVYTHIHVYVYLCMRVYICRERERER